MLSVASVALLGFAAVTVKISIAVFVATALALTLFVVLGQTSRERRRHLAVHPGLCLGIGITVVGPWFVRNVILTGYPLYPEPSFGLQFDWSMPPAAVRDYREVLSDFARVRGPEFHRATRTLNWWSPWLAASWRDSIAPLFIAIATPAAMLILDRKLVRKLGRRWLVLLPIWLALVFWFLTAPDPRYAGSLLLLAAGVPVAFWLPSLPRLARVAALVLACAAVEMPNGSYLIGLAQVPAAVVTGQFAGQEDPPTEALSVFTTDSGLQVYVPVEGDQAWDAPLAATPYPKPALRLRCPRTLACGFAVSEQSLSPPAPAG